MKRCRARNQSLVNGMLMIAVLLAMVSVGSAAEIEHYTYGHGGQPYIDFLKERAERFEEMTGVSVRINVTPGGGPAGYTEQVLLRFVAGETPDVMDIYPSAAGELIEAGVFEDLRPFFERDPVIKTEDIAAPSLGLWEGPAGEIYALPPDVVGVATSYNKTLLAEAGIATPNEMGSDWNWQTMLEITPKLTRDLGGDGTIDQWAFFTNYRDLLGAILAIQQAGGYPFDRPVLPSTAHFDTPEIREAFEFMREVWRLQQGDGRNIAQPGGLNTAFNVWFQSGEVTNMMNSGIDWGVAHQPAGPKGSSTWIGNMGYQIATNSPNKDIAWQWITFISFDESSIPLRLAANGRIPSYLPFLAGFDYQGALGPDVPETVNVFVEQLQDPDLWGVMPYPVSPAFGPIRSRFNQLMPGYLNGETNIQEVFLGVQTEADNRLGKDR